VEPVTPALPVVPEKVHSGVPAPAGAVGHEPAAAAFSLTDEPQADSMSTDDAAHIASTTEAELREKFTAATVQVAAIAALNGEQVEIEFSSFQC
jgi:hypothetical protein